MAIQSWADEQLAILRNRHPQWDLWYVPKFPKGEHWCARPKGHRISTIQVESAEALTAAIAAKEHWVGE